MISPIVLSAFILFFRCSIGGYVTIFLPIFFAQMGFSDFEIGLINTLSPLAIMLGSPVWGAVADSRAGIRKYLMVGLAIFSVICLLSLAIIGLFVPKFLQFWFVLICICLNQFGGGSIGSLLDSLVVEQLPKNAYGKLRLWCAVGYGSAAGVVGIAMLYVKTSIVWLPYVTHFAPAVFCAITSIILMYFLEDVPRKIIHEQSSILNIQDSSKEFKPQPQLSFIQKIQQIPFTLDMFFFIVVIFICGACMGVVNTFLFIFIQDSLHGSQLIMGISVLVTCTFEVPVFYFSDKLLNSIKPDFSLVISLLAYVLRFGLYWIMAGNKMNPWYVLFAESLHGFTFALMWASAVAKATQSISGIGLLNFSVGFISGVLMCGNACGSFVSGLGIQKGISMLWVWQFATYVMSGVCLIWIIISAWNYISFESESKK